MSTEIITYGIVTFGLSVPIIISWWVIFRKAGKPGWAAIIPIYNIVLILEIAELDSSFSNVVMFLIPIFNIIWWFILSYGMASTFNKNDGFAFGLFIFPFIFYPIMAFEKAKTH